MNDDQRVREIFDDLRFPDEPPMAATVSEDVARGRRGLRRRRFAVVGASAAGVVAVAASVALALPSGPGTTLDAGFAGGGTSDSPNDEKPPREPTQPPTNHKPTADPAPSPTNPPADATWGEDEDAPAPSVPPADRERATDQPVPPDLPTLPFPQTRQLLLDAAVEHFDPEHAHLPETSTGFTGGHLQDIADVGTKLSWTNAGEDGMGMVRVAVTSPGYADSEAYALEGFASDVGCEISPDAEGGPNCTEQEVPGGGTVWVAEADTDGLAASAVFERADGSLVGVGVFDLFGNNSTVPVVDIDVEVDEAIAFVTDPDLNVVADELDSTGVEDRPGR